jgi:selenocysteine-specific elongation factor
MFRKPIEQAMQGDRCGICVTNFDAKLMERGLACTPDYLKNVYGVIIKLNKIRHYKGEIENGARFHITIGHETIIGKIELFGDLNDEPKEGFDFNREYVYVDRFESEADPNQASNDSKAPKLNIKTYYVLVDFVETNVNQNVLCAPSSVVIGSKLDTDIHLNQCRIAFYGNVLHSFTNKDYRDPKVNDLAKLRVFKEKCKEGVAERLNDAYTVIGKSLFKKETNLDLFIGLKVTLSSGEVGVIEGSFGQSGKFKIRIPSKSSLR